MPVGTSSLRDDEVSSVRSKDRSLIIARGLKTLGGSQEPSMAGARSVAATQTPPSPHNGEQTDGRTHAVLRGLILSGRVCEGIFCQRIVVGLLFGNVGLPAVSVPQFQVISNADQNYILGQ